MRRSIPLDEIINLKDNVYKTCVVAIKEAESLSRETEEEREKEFGDSKLSSVALSQVLLGEVEYKDKCDSLLKKK